MTSGRSPSLETQRRAAAPGAPAGEDAVPVPVPVPGSHASADTWRARPPNAERPRVEGPSQGDPLIAERPRFEGPLQGDPLIAEWTRVEGPSRLERRSQVDRPAARWWAMAGRSGRLGVVAGLLLCGTACLEDFRSLVTTVAYDPYENVFHVERVLVDVEASFFQCDTVDTCTDAIARAATLQPSDSLQASLADRLVGRLVDTGARNLAIRLERRGEHLDARVTYSAAVGSKAAADTLVHAEWGGKQGREKYYLVLEAQESMEVPDVPHELRKQTLGAAGGGWREFWVLPPKVLEITTRMGVDDETTPLFAALPGLDDALEARGLLGESGGVVAGSPGLGVGAGEAGGLLGKSGGVVAGSPGLTVATAEPESPARGTSVPAAATLPSEDSRPGEASGATAEPTAAPGAVAPATGQVAVPQQGAEPVAAPSSTAAQQNEPEPAAAPQQGSQPDPASRTSDDPGPARGPVVPAPAAVEPGPGPETGPAEPAPSADPAEPTHGMVPAEPAPSTVPPRSEPADDAVSSRPTAIAPPRPVVGELDVGPPDATQASGPEPQASGPAPQITAPVEPPPPPTARAATAWPDPDPDSAARTYLHPIRITGGLAPSVVDRTVEPLVPRAEVCYQRRQAQVPDLAGYVFLNARVRGDGWLVGTSVYGEVADVELIRCLEEAVAGWTFPPWGEPAEIAEVDVPLTFRVEEPTGRKKKRRR